MYFFYNSIYVSSLFVPTTSFFQPSPQKAKQLFLRLDSEIGFWFSNYFKETGSENVPEKKEKRIKKTTILLEQLQVEVPEVQLISDFYGLHIHALCT